MYITAFNNEDKKQFCKFLNIYPSELFQGIKGVRDGHAVAGVGMDGWMPNSVMLHVWLDSPAALSRRFLKECFTYIFKTQNLGIAIGVTPCHNKPALELNKRLGFKEVYRLKDGFSLGTSVAIQVMRREECRWIDEDARCLKGQLQPLPIIPKLPLRRVSKLKT